MNATASPRPPGSLREGLGARRLESAGARLGRALLAVPKQFVAHDGLTQSASVAFFALFALPPTMIVLVSVGNWLLGDEVLSGKLASTLSAAFGQSAGDALSGLHQWRRDSTTGGGWLGGGWQGALFTALALLFSASATFVQLREALNRVFGAAPAVPAPPEQDGKAPPPWWQRGWTWGFLKARLLSLAVLVSAALLVAVSLMLDATLAVLGERYLSGVAALVSHLAALALTWIFLSILFYTIYRVLPDQVVGLRAAAFGGALGATLFMLGKGAFSWYLTRFGALDAFGAASGMAVVLMWLYYSAAVMLIGAEAALSLRRSTEPQAAPSGTLAHTRERLASALTTPRSSTGRARH